MGKEFQEEALVCQVADIPHGVSRYPIEPRIKPLVEQFNAVGFQTYASCQGHMMWIGKGAYPYVAFAAPSTAHMRWFAQKLLADHISDSPSLYWVWEVEPSFNPRFQIVYRLTLRAPHRWWSRFFRSRLDADFASLVRLLQQLRVFSYQMDWIDLEKVPSNSKR